MRSSAKPGHVFKLFFKDHIHSQTRHLRKRVFARFKYKVHLNNSICINSICHTTYKHLFRHRIRSRHHNLLTVKQKRIFKILQYQSFPGFIPDCATFSGFIGNIVVRHRTPEVRTQPFDQKFLVSGNITDQLAICLRERQ